MRVPFDAESWRWLPERTRTAVQPRLPFVLLALLGVLVYANALHAPFVFDDTDAIENNPHLRHLWPPRAALAAPPGSGASGRPLIALSLAANYALGGLDPAGYRAFNVLAHVLCGWVLFALLRGTLRARPGAARSGPAGGGLALAATALWLVHPLQTAAIDHVIYRNEILAGLCLVSTLECVRRAASSPRPARWETAAVAACLAGMASKETMVAAPILALLYDRLFLAGSVREALRRRRAMYVGLAATWLALAACVASGDRGASVTTRYADVTRLGYARTELGVVAHYLRLAFWPAPLVLDYDWPIAPDWRAVAAPALLLCGLGLATLWALRRRSALGFLGAVFFLVLAPSSSFIPLTGAVASEHRMYLPLAAVVVLVVLGAGALARRLVPRARPRRALAIVSTVALGVVLGLLTWRRNEDYASGVAIWTDTVAKRPANPRAQGNLGAALAQEGKLEEAIGPLETALQLAPASAAARATLSGVRRTLGARLAARGENVAARTQLQRAVELAPDDPAALNNLAWLLATAPDLSQRDPTTAVRHAERAVRLTGERDPEVLDTLAAAYAAAGRFEAAVATAGCARSLAVAGGNRALADKIAMRVRLYAAHGAVVAAPVAP